MERERFPDRQHQPNASLKHTQQNPSSVRLYKTPPPPQKATLGLQHLRDKSRSLPPLLVEKNKQTIAGSPPPQDKTVLGGPHKVKKKNT